MILKVKKLVGCFRKKNYKKKEKKKNQKQSRVEKVIRRKSNKPYVKWKGYDCSFNSCIHKKDIVL